MIDRTQLLLPLRRRTLLAVTSLSAAAWAICPVVALLILVAAVITSMVIGVVFVAALIVGWIALVGGILVMLGGMAEGGDAGLGGAGLLAAALGMGLVAVAPSLNVGEMVFLAMTAQAQLVLDWFIAHNWCVWAWIPAGLAIVLAAITWCVILLARYVPDLLRRCKRKFHDCHACHHRGRPAYACPKCGSFDPDLRPSGYGILNARCQMCRTWVSTLDILGRRRLFRRCSHCDTALDHPDLGRLPVWHVVVAYCDRKFPPRTRIFRIAARLVFVHESGIEHLAATRSASSLAYLGLLDQLVVVGSERSLGKTLPLKAGFLGVLERSTMADIRRHAGVPAGIVTRDSKPLSLLTQGRTGAADNWRLDLQTLFTGVATWTGKFNAKSLASVIRARPTI